MLFDDECYLMPEEIGIPQHVQRVLKSPSFPIDSSRTLPHLSQIRNREVSGSLPNVSENSHLPHEPWAKVQTLPWAMVCYWFVYVLDFKYELPINLGKLWFT